jgi:hypothetical protein
MNFNHTPKRARAQLRIILVLSSALLSIAQVHPQVDIKPAEFPNFAQPQGFSSAYDIQGLQDINGAWSRLVDRLSNVLEKIHGSLMNGLIIYLPKQDEVVDAATQARLEQAVAEIRITTDFLSKIKTGLQKYQQEIFVPTPRELINRITVLAHATRIVRVGLEQKFNDLAGLKALMDQPIDLPTSTAQLLEYLAVDMHREIQNIDATIDCLGSNSFQRFMRKVDSTVIKRVPWKMVGGLTALVATGYALQRGLVWYHGAEAQNPGNTFAEQQANLKISQELNILNYMGLAFGSTVAALIMPSSEHNIFRKIAADMTSSYIGKKITGAKDTLLNLYDAGYHYAHYLYQSKVLAQNPADHV